MSIGCKPCPLPPSPWKDPEAVHQHTPNKGDKSLKTLRKETASIQTKSSPEVKKKKKEKIVLRKYPGAFSHINSPGRL